MKKKITTVVALILCAVLLVAGSVAATLAYLSDASEVVTNTFTVGNVQIDLDEAKVDIHGNPVAPAERVRTNKYKLIPDQEYTKDPTVTVKDGSEASYLFIKIDGLAGLQAVESDADGYTNIAAQIAANGWVALGDGVYVYANGAQDGYETVAADGGDVTKVIFNNFKIADNKTADVLGAVGDVKVVACAIQADQVPFDGAKAEAATILADLLV